MIGIGKSHKKGGIYATFVIAVSVNIFIINIITHQLYQISLLVLALYCRKVVRTCPFFLEKIMFIAIKTLIASQW